MDQQSKEQVWGAITALNHLMAATWETMLLAYDDPLAELHAARARMLTEMEPEHIKGVTSQASFASSQHAIVFLEKFWQRMEEQVRFQLE